MQKADTPSPAVIQATVAAVAVGSPLREGEGDGDAVVQDVRRGRPKRNIGED